MSDHNSDDNDDGMSVSLSLMNREYTLEEDPLITTGGLILAGLILVFPVYLFFWGITNIQSIISGTVFPIFGQLINWSLSIFLLAVIFFGLMTPLTYIKYKLTGTGRPFGRVSTENGFDLWVLGTAIQVVSIKSSIDHDEDCVHAEKEVDTTEEAVTNNE